MAKRQRKTRQPSPLDESIRTREAIVAQIRRVEAEIERLREPDQPLPCGCQGHSSEETVQYYASWVDPLIAKLRKKGPLDPGPYPPYPPSNENKQSYMIKQYFSIIKRRLPQNRYLYYVDLWTQANRGILQDPCQFSRHASLLPLIPMSVPGLPHTNDLLTPRPGGRRKSPLDQKRDALIQELKQQGLDDRSTCKTLHQRHIPFPDSWKQQGATTWEEAYVKLKSRVQTFLSKRGTKRKTRP